MEKSAKTDRPIRDQRAVVQYLQHIVFYRDSIKNALSFIEHYKESEQETREAISCRSLLFSEPKVMYTPSSDRKFFQIIEDHETETKQLELAVKTLKKQIVSDLFLLRSIRDSVLLLKEPHRSIFILRYFEKKPWKFIQERIGKSSSYTYQLHLEGLHSLVKTLDEESIIKIKEQNDRNQMISFTKNRQKAPFDVYLHDHMRVSNAL